MSFKTHSGHIIQQAGCGLVPELRIVKGKRQQVKGAMCVYMGSQIQVMVLSVEACR